MAKKRIGGDLSFMDGETEKSLTEELGKAVQKTGDTMTGQLDSPLVTTKRLIVNAGDANTGIELGGKGYSFIDFHTTGAQNNDYDSRIIASDHNITIEADNLNVIGTVLENGVRVYSPSNPPPGSGLVDAVKKTGDTMTGSLTLNGGGLIAINNSNNLNLRGEGINLPSIIWQSSTGGTERAAMYMTSTDFNPDILNIRVSDASGNTGYGTLKITGIIQEYGQRVYSPNNPPPKDSLYRHDVQCSQSFGMAYLTFYLRTSAALDSTALRALVSGGSTFNGVQCGGLIYGSTNTLAAFRYNTNTLTFEYRSTSGAWTSISNFSIYDKVTEV